MNQQQKQNARKFRNLFERGNPADDGAANVENDDDGRGYTVGCAGFTTANGDALAVIVGYGKVHSYSRLTPFIPELLRLSKLESDDVSHLGGFAAAWKFEAQNASFKAVQETVSDRLYFDPAMDLAREHGFLTALAQAAIWDCALLCGAGDDHDSVGQIMKRALALPVPNYESIRLARFLDAWRVSLEDPRDPATRDCWREAVSRIDVWEELLIAKNWDLELPVTLQTKDYQGETVE